MYAVILAGGGGTRLWPLSRVARPKPFLALAGDATLLQATVARLQPLIDPADVFIVADGRYRDLVREQLPEIPDANLIEEPVGRNTAAAVALAALLIERPDDEIMIVLAADHAIADAAGFREALTAAAERAADGSLVTLGIRPTGPETGYGYVLAATGAAATGTASAAVPVERFVEKPSRERAAELLAGGRAYWNASIFVWRRSAAIDGLERHARDIIHGVRDALDSGDLEAAYPAIRSTSVDYALLEPASTEGRVAVVPIDVGWSDVGSWAALMDVQRDVADGGSVSVAGSESQTMDIGSSDVLVRPGGERLVVTVGLEGVVVVDTPDALLVLSRDRAQDVKLVVDRLRSEGREDLL